MKSYGEYKKYKREDAFHTAISKEKEDSYVIGIAPIQPLAKFEWNSLTAQQLLERQLSMYAPIIQRFMILAKMRKL